MLRLLSYSEAAGLLDDIGEICDVAHVRLWSYRNKFEFSRTFGQQQYVILRQYFYCTDTVGRGVSGGTIVSGTVCPLLRLYVCFFSFFHFELPAAHKKRCYNAYKKQLLVDTASHKQEEICFRYTSS